MNRGQIRGMIAIVPAIIIVVIGGIVLSFLAVDILSATQVVIVAFLFFLLVTPLIGYGVYTYARATEAESLATNEEMEKPRQLLDILRDQGQSDVYELANQLQTTPESIKHYIHDLSNLELFSGIADWKNGVIAMLNPMVIEALETCKTCQNPIQIRSNATTCPHCGTEYYKI